MTPCGVVATCGRPLGHRGHHGGFRPLLPLHPPAQPHMRGEVLGAPLSPREVEALRTYARLGSQSESAAEMSVSYQTLKNTLGHAYAKLGARGVMEAMFIMGWLRIPTDQEVAVYDYDRRFSELSEEIAELVGKANDIASGLSDVLAE
jgi:DNA-binding CsgD family transcriptional regulator